MGIKTININSSHNRNWLINGDMNISQRGTSFVSPADGAYTLDRFQYGKIGAMTHTVTQDTDVPTFAQAGYAFQNSLRLNLTAADTAIAATDFCSIRQKIEGYNYVNLAQRTFTLSFWVKATLAGIYCVSFRNSTPDRSYVSEYTINASNTWEFKSITVTPSPSTGGWNYTNGTGLQVDWTIAAGTSLQTTAGAWQSSNSIATANIVNGVNTGATDFKIAGAMLNLGPAALQYRLFSEGPDDMEACQRYLEVFGNSATASRPLAMGVVSVANTTAILLVGFAVKKRANTVPTWSSISHLQMANASINTVATGFADKGCGIDAAWMDISFSATIAGNSGLAFFFNSTAGRLYCSCEL